MIDAYQYYQNMEQNHIMLLFKGHISSELLSSILQITENKLERINEKPKIRKKVFNVLVECLQNVYHHIDPKELKNNEGLTNESSAILMIGKEDKQYFIITGNHVLQDKVESLKKRLDELNAMSREELKDQYKEVLSNGGFSDKGGAGLGFIDILRKSGEKIEYVFRDINSTYAFFTLKVNIPNKNSVKKAS